jgi:hypothetical protein
MRNLTFFAYLFRVVVTLWCLIIYSFSTRYTDQKRLGF